jgi:sigma-E factor negative regulatory protein RseC
LAIEQGIVIKMGPHGSSTAWVKTVRSSACESCAARESCSPGGAKSHEVEALNDAGALVGDRIQFAISSASILKATFLLYLFPILCLLAGGIIGNALAQYFQTVTSAVTVISALLSFGLSMLVVRIGGQSMGQKAAFRPRIIRVLARDSGISAQAAPTVVCVNDIAERR